eukprot:TRINITY_DN1442_c0_g1_i1.p1 TRINITY_DN1442_c0_g1~~TRINITY_DN1442_c0_g1_i1.p1  ORF type:complete len:430 (-),score=101.98 TRINITY_DN1442_c0_g1_i1:85-1374(-)
MEMMFMDDEDFEEELDESFFTQLNEGPNYFQYFQHQTVNSNIGNGIPVHDPNYFQQIPGQTSNPNIGNQHIPNQTTSPSIEQEIPKQPSNPNIEHEGSYFDESSFGLVYLGLNPLPLTSMNENERSYESIFRFVHEHRNEPFGGYQTRLVEPKRFPQRPEPLPAPLSTEPGNEWLGWSWICKKVEGNNRKEYWPWDNDGSKPKKGSLIGVGYWTHKENFDVKRRAIDWNGEENSKWKDFLIIHNVYHPSRAKKSKKRKVEPASISPTQNSEFSRTPLSPSINDDDYIEGETIQFSRLIIEQKASGKAEISDAFVIEHLSKMTLEHSNHISNHEKRISNLEVHTKAKIQPSPNKDEIKIKVQDYLGIYEKLFERKDWSAAELRSEFNKRNPREKITGKPINQILNAYLQNGIIVKNSDVTPPRYRVTSHK